METQWKSIINVRIKQRNINQGKTYKDIIEAYTVLLEEKNKLLATVASLSEDANHLLQNSFNYISTTYSSKNVLSKINLSKESILSTDNNVLLKYSLSKENFIKENISTEEGVEEEGAEEGEKGKIEKKGEELFIKHNTFNYSSIFPSPNGSVNNTRYKIDKHIPKVDSFQSIVTKKEFFDIIKEKGKNEELINLLKNSVNEKERWINLITKENEKLKKNIIKKEKENFENRKEISKLNEAVKKKELELKLYLKDSHISRNKLKTNEKVMKELIEEYENMKYENCNMIKQIGKMKQAKQFKDKECSTLTQQILKLNRKNEKLLKYILTCKRKHRNELVKIKNAYLGKSNLEQNVSNDDSNCIRYLHRHIKEPSFLIFSKLHELHVLKRYFEKLKQDKFASVIRR